MIMHRLAALGVLLLGLPGCQRLDADPTGGDDDSSPSDGTGTTSNDTLPDDDDDESEDDDDEGEDESGGPAFDCDPIAQSGCNGDDKCTVVLQAGNVGYTCVADELVHAAFESCDANLSTGLDGCPAGHACLTDEAEQGICAPLCLDSGDCANGTCIPELAHDIPYCAEDCSPFEASCPAPLQCRRLDDQFGCSFPRTDDVGDQGAPCSTAGDVGCAEGFACLPGGVVPGCASDNCCTLLCDTNVGNCESPATCTTLFDAPAPGAESIGVCIVPS